MSNHLGRLLVAVLVSAVGAAAVIPSPGWGPAWDGASRAVVSAPGQEHDERGDSRLLGALEGEKEETERSGLDLGLVCAPALLAEHVGHGTIARGVSAPLHPMDPIAAHAARGPPSA